MWRIVVAVVLLLLSLLVMAKAPTNFLWKVAIAITEFPYIFILVSLAFLVSCFYAEKYRLLVMTISGMAAFFYLLPVIEAYIRGGPLEADLRRALPFTDNERQMKQPFSLVKLLTGVNAKEITPRVLVYKQMPETLTLDFYPANTSGKAPCLIVIHGGSWASGDNKEIPALNSYLAARGCHVAAINYRLAPAYRSPAPVEDTRDAIAFLRSQARQLNIDTANFILLGRSAGAQVALVAAYTLHDPGIKGAVSFYGPADMVWGARIRSNKLVLNTDKVFRDYLGGLIDEVPLKYHEASAYDAVDKSSPPTLLIHGPHDALVAYGHSVRLDKKLEALGIPHYFLNLPWATHGCDYNFSGPSGQLSTFAIERFINSVTTPH